MIDFLITMSGGLIKSEKQARIVLIVVALVTSGLAVSILLSQSKTIFKKKTTEIKFIPGQEEYYRTIQPFK